jgi:long-chain acyl-CoA synthetase
MERDVTVGRMVERRIAESPKSAAVRWKEGDAFREADFETLGKRMERIAAGLLTVPGFALAPRAAITILGNSSYDWIACDFAALSIGLRTVPIYATLLMEECGFLHVDSGAVLAICDDAAQFEKLRALRGGFTFLDTAYEASSIPLAHIVVIDPRGITPSPEWESLETLEARGERSLADTAERRRELAALPKREDTCTYTYTSGTTGAPKGVVQTNENMLAMLENIAKTGMFHDDVVRDGLFLFLPMAHSFGRLIELAAPFFGAPVICSSVPTLLEDLNATRPGFFPAAPRVFEKMKSRIESKVAGAPPMRQRLFRWAMAAGEATIPYRNEGRAMPFGVRTNYALANKLVLSKLRAALGLDRARLCLSGSAPLNRDVHAFFLSMGLDLIEAYGLTETCPGLTANLPGKAKLGTVGRPLPGVTLRIAEDGEIIAKGPNITAGYLNRDDATREAIDEEGWFHTGDLGSQDEDGFVTITGRKKELMKTSGGKYVVPAKLEGRLKNHPLVQEVVTIADTRNFVAALIAVDIEELAAWAERTGNPADMHHPSVRAEVEAHVKAVNGTLASFETVKTFTFVPPMTVDTGLLTASLKVKRKEVYARYADEIDGLYRGTKD